LVSAFFTIFHLNYLQVVSPDQAKKIYKAIKDKGLPVALVEYEGEQHGFRKVCLTTPDAFICQALYTTPSMGQID
jgi:acetyl esterase/lipase